MKEIRKSIWIDAPPDVVFRYFTDAEKFARWAGIRAELNPVPGGIFRHDMGVSGVVEGRYLRVEPGRFLSWEVRAPEGVDIPPSVIEVTITPEADGSRIEVRQTGLAAPFDAMASRGLDHHLARLSVVVQGGTPAADSLCKRSMESLAGGAAR
ncbi:MAG: SRPBCC domain-containing protein [Gemmatimonadetes bacterium]|nr:SRPBCC domain-containing protein [Gemmatimonadota bacterium]